jgi:hypothetical protein
MTDSGRVQDGRRVEQELWNFLRLGAETGEPLVPPRLVDDAWHELLRDGPAYKRACVAAFGRPLEHVETDTRHPEGYRRTRALMRERFGALDERVWGVDAMATCLLASDAPTKPPPKRTRAAGHLAT